MTVRARLPGTESPVAERVLYIQYSDPAAYPPLEHSARLLAGLGCEVLLLGIDLFEGKLEPVRGDRLDTRLMAGSRRGWRQKLHYLRFSWWVLRVASRWRASWIYASDPLACPPALVLSWLGWRVVYHEHDAPEPATLAGASLAMRAALAARRALGHRADLCVVPNQERANRFGRESGRPDVYTVWNCPLRSEVRPERPRRAAGPLRVLYHGSIVPARLPLAVVGALAKLRGELTLVVVGYETAGHGGYVDALRAAAKEAGVLSRLEIVGTVASRVRLLEVCASCDVGLALMPTRTDSWNERTMTGASNKPFDYLASGLAVLVADLPDWDAMFVETGYGRGCVPESAESIAEALQWFVDHPEERHRMGEMGRRRVETAWHYEAQFSPVLERLIGRHAPAATRPSPARNARRLSHHDI